MQNQTTFHLSVSYDIGQKGKNSQPTSDTCFSQVNIGTDKLPQNINNNNKFKALRKLLRK